MDRLAAEYSDRVDFVAPAWKGTMEATAQRARQLFRSGAVMWGLDEAEIVFGSYGVPYQPVTVLIAADDTVFAAWAGIRSEEEMRSAIEDLVSFSG